MAGLVVGTNNFGDRIANVAEALDAIAELGINEVDCARAYNGGAAEEALGAAGWAERGFILASKTHWAILGDERVREDMEKTRAALRLKEGEKLPIYYLHSPDVSQPLLPTLQTVVEMYKEGLFTELGVSNFTAWQVMQIRDVMREMGGPMPAVYQGAYNCVQRDVERDLIPLCRAHGMRFYGYSPLARGVLTAKFDGTDDDSLNGLQQRYMSNAMDHALSALADVCEANSLDVKDAALRWLVHHSSLDGEQGDKVILGSSSVDQLRENAEAAAAGQLPDAVVEALDATNAALHPVPAYPGDLGVMELGKL